MRTRDFLPGKVHSAIYKPGLSLAEINDKVHLLAKCNGCTAASTLLLKHTSLFRVLMALLCLVQLHAFKPPTRTGRFELNQAGCLQVVADAVAQAEAPATPPGSPGNELECDESPELVTIPGAHPPGALLLSAQVSFSNVPDVIGPYRCSKVEYQLVSERFARLHPPFSISPCPFASFFLRFFALHGEGREYLLGVGPSAAWWLAVALHRTDWIRQ